MKRSFGVRLSETPWLAAGPGCSSAAGCSLRPQSQHAGIWAATGQRGRWLLLSLHPRSWRPSELLADHRVDHPLDAQGQYPLAGARWLLLHRLIQFLCEVFRGRKPLWHIFDWPDLNVPAWRDWPARRKRLRIRPLADDPRGVDLRCGGLCHFCCDIRSHNGSGFRVVVGCSDIRSHYRCHYCSDRCSGWFGSACLKADLRKNSNTGQFR